MTLQVELTEEETHCLHGYFERVDRTEDLSFLHPAEYRAFQRIANQVCKASSAAFKSNYGRLVDMARRAVVRTFGDHRPSTRFSGKTSSLSTVISATGAIPHHEALQAANDTLSPRPRDGRAMALARACATGFALGDARKVAELFSLDARIVSPALGCLTARTFLAKVIGTSANARLTLHDVVTNIEGRPQARGYFIYADWPTAEGCTSPVDRRGVFNYVLNFDDSGGRIESMIIL